MKGLERGRHGFGCILRLHTPSLAKACHPPYACFHLITMRTQLYSFGCMSRVDLLELSVDKPDLPPERVELNVCHVNPLPAREGVRAGLRHEC